MKEPTCENSLCNGDCGQEIHNHYRYTAEDHDEALKRCAAWGVAGEVLLESTSGRREMYKDVYRRQDMSDEIGYREQQRLFDSVLTALDDLAEAKRELEQMRSEYTGYSPGYHLHSWMDAERKAKERLMVALNEYVDFRIAKAGGRGA